MSARYVTNRLFCAVESEKAGDSLAGSGAHAQENLLISWPSRKWMRSLRRATDMSESVVNGIEAIVDSGRRVNLIHREQQPAEQHRVYLMPENVQIDLMRDQLPDFLDALNCGASLEAWFPTPNPSPLVLCCTHGKKDKCCAKFGHATFKSLVQAEGEANHNFDVWQSSHLGGCRFAASVMVFPANRKYGRIAPDEVMPFLEALPDASGKTVVADVQWEAGTSAGLLRVQCEATAVLRYDTCADITPDGPTESTVWIAKGIVQVNGLPAC